MELKSKPGSGNEVLKKWIAVLYPLILYVLEAYSIISISPHLGQSIPTLASDPKSHNAGHIGKSFIGSFETFLAIGNLAVILIRVLLLFLHYFHHKFEFHC